MKPQMRTEHAPSLCGGMKAENAQKGIVTLPPKYLTMLTMSSMLLALRQNAVNLRIYCESALVTKSFFAVEFKCQLRLSSNRILLLAFVLARLDPSG